MKYLTWFGVILFSSCSHYQAAQDQVVVDLPFAADLVQEIQKTASREPASLGHHDSSKSPKRIYFSALYHQYLTFGRHLAETTEMNSCPQFHHDKIETDAVIIPNFSLFKSSLFETEKQYFPESVFTNKFSLLDHFKQIKSEVETLCEEGISDNYYKFDNLVTYYASKENFHKRPDSMRAVLKIPVFANYYLLKMLQSNQRMAIIHPNEKDVIKVTHTHWFENYVNRASQVRSSFIKNKMVQR